MPGQCLLAILGGVLSLALPNASAQSHQQQQGQRQVSSLATGGGMAGVGRGVGVFRHRRLRGGSGAGSTGGLLEMVATTTATSGVAAKTIAAMSESSSRDRSAEAASAPGVKRTIRRGGDSGVVGGEETVADGGGARGATVEQAAEGADGASREESERKGARAREIKQGSRGSNTGDDGGVEDNAEPQSIAVIVLCIGAVTLFLIGWCWLSSVVVCMSCCVCKCVKRTSSSSSSVSGNPNGKYVDTYANAVQATLCGDLASVVCVPDGSDTGTTEDGASKDSVSTSQSCTPHFSGDGTASGSSSNDSKRFNRAATRLASAMTDANIGGPDATGATSSSSSSSSSSAFSAIFRRSLTATAVAPVTPTSHDDSNKSEIHETPFPSVIVEEGTRSGGGGGGEGPLFYQAEEKQSETSGRDSATVPRSPWPAARHGIRLFGGADERRSRAGGRIASGDERGRASPATPARPWTSRFWARIGVTDRGRVGSSNTVYPPGAAAVGAGAAESGRGVGQSFRTNALTSSEGSSGSFAEGVDGGQCNRAGDHPPVSHRRRGGPRSGSQRRRVGPRASDGGLSGISDRHVRDCATPDIISPETSDNFSSSSSSSSGGGGGGGGSGFATENCNHRRNDGDDDGRGSDSVATASGGGGVAGVASPTAAEAVETDGDGAPDENAHPALLLQGGTTTTTADVGSAANNPGARLVGENITTGIAGGCGNGGGGREGEARSASEYEDIQEATGAISGGGKNSCALREGGSIAAGAASAAGAAGAALARSDHLARPEANQAQNQNRSEGRGEDDDDAGRGTRTGQTQPQTQGARADGGRFPCRPGDTKPQTPALPIARVLWRAFSEVDHEKIGETHRLAAQRHQARFGPAPGVQNPPVCRTPVYNPL